MFSILIWVQVVISEKRWYDKTFWLFLQVNVYVFEEYSLKAFEWYVALSEKVVLLEARKHTCYSKK